MAGASPGSEVADGVEEEDGEEEEEEWKREREALLNRFQEALNYCKWFISMCGVNVLTHRTASQGFLANLSVSEHAIRALNSPSHAKCRFQHTYKSLQAHGHTYLKMINSTSVLPF